MAIFHMQIQVIGRSSGRSAVAAAAYRAGERLRDDERGRTYNYTNKKEVVYREVMLCDHAPAAYLDRATLWNEVQNAEKACDGRFAREINVALPREWGRDMQIAVLRDYINRNFVSAGMCADIAIHDKQDGNPHAHIMLTTRAIEKNGKWSAKEKKVYALDAQGNKIPIIDPETGKQKIGARGRRMWKRVTVLANPWNDRSNIEKWRSDWARTCNQYLAAENQIDHRSFARRNVMQIPTVHLGQAASAMEKKGIVTERGERNRTVIAQNTQHRQNIEEAEKLKVEIQTLEKQYEKQKQHASLIESIPVVLGARIPFLYELDERLRKKNEELRTAMWAKLPSQNDFHKEAAAQISRNALTAAEEAVSMLADDVLEKEGRKQKIEKLLRGPYHSSKEPGFFSIFSGRYREWTDTRDAYLNEWRELKKELADLTEKQQKAATNCNIEKSRYDEAVRQMCESMMNTAMEATSEKQAMNRLEKTEKIIDEELRHVCEAGKEEATRHATKTMTPFRAMEAFYKRLTAMSNHQKDAAEKQPASPLMEAMLAGIVNGDIPPVAFRSDKQKVDAELCNWELMANLEKDAIRTERYHYTR